jgi:hypothetical protein
VWQGLGVSAISACAVEVITTFALVFTVFLVAVDQRVRTKQHTTRHATYNTACNIPHGMQHTTRH